MHKASSKNQVKGQSSNCSFLCIRTIVAELIQAGHFALNNDFQGVLMEKLNDFLSLSLCLKTRQ